MSTESRAVFTVSASSWHLRMMRWVWNDTEKGTIYVPRDLCSYFWSVVGMLVVVPFLFLGLGPLALGMWVGEIIASWPIWRAPRTLVVAIWMPVWAVAKHLGYPTLLLFTPVVLAGGLGIGAIGGAGWGVGAAGWLLIGPLVRRFQQYVRTSSRQEKESPEPPPVTQATKSIAPQEGAPPQSTVGVAGG